MSFLKWKYGATAKLPLLTEEEKENFKEIKRKHGSKRKYIRGNLRTVA